MSGVQIRVRADSTQARNDLRRLERSVSNIERTTDNVTRGFRRLAIGISAAFTGVALTRGLSSATDNLTNLENKLALVTGRGAELSKTLRSLYGISAQARLPIATATDTFNRFGLALQDSNKSTQEILKATDAVLKSATLSGATAESANAAIIQLGQGLSSGQLRGEELNSVLEQMPRLARAIADGMGIPFGRLRELAKDGKLDAEAVFAAIIDQAGNIDSEFQTLEATISGLTTVLKDEFTRALGALDQEIGFSDNLAKAIIAATNGLRFFADNLGFWATVYRARLNLIVNDFVFFKASIQRVFRENFDVDLTPVLETIEEISNKVASLAFGDNKEIGFSVAALDLGQFIPSINSVKSAVVSFITFIERQFFWLYDKVIANSWWSDIFWKGENQIGGPKFLAALDFVRVTLSAWATSIETIFSGLFESISGKWNEIVQFLTTAEFQTPGGLTYFQPNQLGRGIDYAIEKMKVFKDVLAETFALSESTGTIDPETLNFQYELTPLGKFLEMLQDTGDGIFVYLSDNFQNVIDKLYEVWQGGGSTILRAVAPIGALATTAAVGVADALSQGQLIAKGFVSQLLQDAEALGGAIALALIAKTALGLSFRTLLLSIGALVISADVLNSAATQESLRSIAKGIGTFIATFFEDGGSDEIGSAILTGLAASIRAIGEGLTEGLTGDSFDSEFANELVGAIAVVITAAALSGAMRGLLFKAGSAIVLGMFSSSAILAKLASFALAPILTNAFLSLYTHPALTAATRGLGHTLGTSIQVGLILGLTTGLASAISNAVRGASNSISEGVQRFVTGQTPEEQTASNASEVIRLLNTGTQGVRAIALMVDEGLIASEELSLIGEDNLNRLKTALDQIEPGILDTLTGFSIFENSLDELAKSIEEARETIASGVQLNSVVSDPSAPLTPPAFASGGAVYGAGGPTDDKIPALLSDGEFVMKAAAVDKFGVGFLDRLNAGMMPKMFNAGGLATLNGQLATIDGLIADTQGDMVISEQLGETGRIAANRRSLSDLFSRRADIQSQIADLNSVASDIGSGDSPSSLTTDSSSSTKEDDDDEATKLAETFANGFKDTFKSALATFLIDGDVNDFTEALLDNFTMSIINSFTEGFTNSLFEALGVDDWLESAFQGVEDWAGGIGEKTGGSIQKGFAGIDFGAMFESISTFFSDLFSGLGGGGGGGGGFFSSVLSLFGGGGGVPVVGANAGGLIKPLNTSRTDMDSVPAMLTPGELVVPADKVDSLLNGQTGNSQTFNINVSGDVSRQTRKEIVQMLPQIASGVNTQNRENNYRR